MEYLPIILENYSLEKEYKCSPYITSADFTPLMMIVMNTCKYPQLNNIIKNYKNIVNFKNKKGYTAFMLAVTNCNTCSSLNTIRELINIGANIDIKNDEEDTALTLASKYGYESSSPAAVQLLIDHGADVNLQNDDGDNALLLAIYNMNRHSLVVEMLMKTNIDIHAVNNIKHNALGALCSNVLYVDLDLFIDKFVHFLIKKGIDPYIEDYHGWNPMITACVKNNINLVKILLANGVNPNVLTKNKCSPLVTLMKFNKINKYMEIIELLLFCGADVNIKQMNDKTLLMTACKKNLVGVVKLLLAYDVDIHACDMNKRTALFYTKNIAIASLLINAGINVNHVDNFGNTVLDEKCRKCSNMIEYFVLSGATVSYQAIDHACSNIWRLHINTIELLLNHTNTIEVTSLLSNFSHNNNLMKLLLQYVPFGLFNHLLLHEKNGNINLILEAMNEKYKEEKMKIVYYERVLKFIPAHDAKIRFKINNMGYKISMYNYEGSNIDTNELLVYLGATPDNLQQKIEDYLNVNV